MAELRQSTMWAWLIVSGFNKECLRLCLEKERRCWGEKERRCWGETLCKPYPLNLCILRWQDKSKGNSIFLPSKYSTFFPAQTLWIVSTFFLFHWIFGFLSFLGDAKQGLSLWHWYELETEKRIDGLKCNKPQTDGLKSNKPKECQNQINTRFVWL